ncbi:MAG: hypothetical protein NDJ90_04190 [Oligoflexia bacterium]|nr:hypothetical protein [Oligoflexia bacterium]
MVGKLIGTLGLAAVIAFPSVALAAKDVVREGVAEVLTMDNFKEKKSEKVVYLREERRATRLHLNEDQLKTLKPGSRIRVTGTESGGALQISGLQAITTDTTTTSTTTGTSSSLQPLVSGNQRVLVMNMRFIQDGIVTESYYTNSELESAVFAGAGSVNSFYQKSSFGLVSLSGDVVGPLTVDISGAGACDLGTWMLRSDAAATAAGINLSLYQHKVYLLPSNTSCPAGVAGYGGGGKALIFTPWGTNQTIVGHELGHSMGMGHARSGYDEYGDNSCIMAHPVPASMNNAPHKIFMGWIPQERVQTVTSPGVYRVATSDADLSTTQALRIPVPNSTAGEAYYISYRTSQGFQSRDYAKYFGKKVSVHLCKWNSCSGTDLVSFFGLGGVYSDPQGLMHISVDSLGSSDASVKVSFGADTEPPSAPTGVSVSIAAKGRSTGVTVRWTAALDNLGVAKYRVFIKSPSGLVREMETTQTSYTLGLALETGTYEAWIVAIDSSGNESAASISASVTY